MHKAFSRTVKVLGAAVVVQFMWTALCWAVPRPPGPDLEVTFINRSPMYERYRVDYPGGKPVLTPGTENARRWPTNDELVTFTAHIANRGTTGSGACSYKWFIDGAEVASGPVPALGAGQETTVAYQWPWAHQMNGEQVLDDHFVRCTVDPDNVVAESFENNNSLEDATAAMALRFVITPQMVTNYSNAVLLNEPFSAENWLQRQIAAMNTNFARSKFPVIPNGAGLRVRINEIIVASSQGTDFANDGGWFVNGDYRTGSGGYEAATDIDWSLVHELSHQVGLIDNYNYNVESDTVHVLASDGMRCNFGYSWPRPDLMGGGDIAPYTDGRYYSSFTAGGAEMTKGFRRGYYGDYQFDIPRTNFIRVLDNQGNPAADVQVALYQRQDDGSGIQIDNTPEITGTTDSDGRFQLPNRSVGGEITTRTGHTLRDNPFGVVDVVGGRNTFLVKLGRADHEEFVWLNLSAFNLVYWSGNTNSAELTLASHVPAPGAPLAPLSLAARIAGQRVALCWDNVGGAVGYYVYGAYSPEYTYQRVSGLLTTNCFTVASQPQNRVYVVVAVDGSGRESAFSRFVWAPRLVNPTAIGIALDGKRIVLDPQNGHALLEQRADGQFIRNIGSVHYHLEFTRFLSINSLDRLLMNHPADFYSSRHSVLMANREAMPLLEFGQRGSGAGQFETPAGVAARGKSKTIAGPWSVDAHTLLLLHLDGSYNGEQGEAGNASNTSFTAGQYTDGVLITGTGRLTFPSSDNISRDQGAVEFWFKPNWDGTNTTARYFLANGVPFNNGFQIVKDGANNLRFMRWRGASEDGIGYNISSWKANEWHHIAVTWTTNAVALYVDGQSRASKSTIPFADQLAATLYIGSSSSGTSQADGVFDEFRISDVARVGNSDTADYTIFVADSGNHRVQAFTETGTFLAAFGSLGSGAGQFNDPRGLAVDAFGRIIVADRNNNRLQILSFVGTNFASVQTVTGAFNRPVGVAAYRDSRWIVADTGNNRITILSTNGTVLGSYSAPNDGSTGNFLAPEGVITDANGNILVADTGNKRIVSLQGLLPTNEPPRFLPEFNRWSTSNGFEARIVTTPGRSLLLQSSTDLSNWIPLTNLTPSGSTADLRDASVSSAPWRFYRAILQ